MSRLPSPQSRATRAGARRGRAAALSIPAIALVTLALVATTAAARSEPLRNLVLVTIDTLRADHLGLHGYPRPTSPFLDLLASRSAVFENAFASTSYTAPAHASLFTSLQPVQHGLLINGHTLDTAIPTLASLLRERGSRTAAFTSVSFLAGLGTGFEELDLPLDPAATYRPADRTVDAALEWHRRRSEEPDERSADRPFFLWIHLYDVHQYGVRAPVRERYLERMRRDSEERGEKIRAFLESEHGIAGSHRPKLLERYDRYDAQIAFVDEQLERLFAALEKDTAGETLWIITSDHGEGLGNHRFWGHGRYIWNEHLRVPLILYAGERRWAPSRVEALVRHVDLLPTIVELLGVPLDRDALRLEGHSLVPLLEDRDASVPIDFAFAQRRPKGSRTRWEPGVVIAAQDLRFKYILHSEGPDELYDLASDPRELENLIGEGLPEEQRLLRWLTSQYREKLSDRRYDADASNQIEQQYLEELKALGYVE